MKIDLSKVDVFEDSELELDKKITIIFGKNGTGKSTIAEKIRELSSDYDISIFQGFNNVIDENQKLNAVVLGEENLTINKLIEQKKKEIEQNEIEIEKIRKTISKPVVDGISNYWTKKENAIQKYEKTKTKIDNFYQDSASKIKKLSNPQIASTSYNKNSFQNEMKYAKLLKESEIEELSQTIRSEVKIAPDIFFPNKDMMQILNEINTILQKKIAEKVKIKRLDNQEKKEFAHTGFMIHKKGDICAFCGNEIKDEVFDELERYFSADEVKEFQMQIYNKEKDIDLLIENVSNIQIASENFYPSYKKEVEIVKTEIENLKKTYIEFLNNIKDVLEDKQKHLFESTNKVEFETPISFSDIEKKYKDIQKCNNENDLVEKKEEAKNKIRYHEIKKLMDEFDYSSKKANFDALFNEMNERKREFEDENLKINGHGGLQEKINNLTAEIMDLQGRTKNESILAENINKKLLHMVSFKLERFEDSESKGFYKVKDCNTGVIRNITELSTGEKNIIAFLYFIEKLDEVKDTVANKDRIIVFDDPMNSNDDGMQYLIIEELQALMKKLLNSDHFILLTHNKHFYINVRYNNDYKKDKFIRLQSNGTKTKIIILEDENNDFKTSYESLWIELKHLYEYDLASPDILLNPIRRIIETFTKFNGIKKKIFYNEVSGAKKLFDVNSHSIDDIEAELNGKNKDEIIQLFFQCFDKNKYRDHFLKYFKGSSVDGTGKLIINK